MASRVMLSPVTEPKPNVLVPKAEQYCDRGCAHFFPSSNDGRNASPWVLTVGRSSNWAIAAADPEITFLFAIPNNVDTPDELKAWLRATTVGDLPAGQRTGMQTVFDANGLTRSDFSLTTPLSRVVQRVISSLMEKDFNYGFGFHF